MNCHVISGLQPRLRRRGKGIENLEESVLNPTNIFHDLGRLHHPCGDRPIFAAESASVLPSCLRKHPYGTLVKRPGGNFYGAIYVSEGGGYGKVFRLWQAGC